MALFTAFGMQKDGTIIFLHLSTSTSYTLPSHLTTIARGYLYVSVLEQGDMQKGGFQMMV